VFCLLFLHHSKRSGVLFIASSLFRKEQCINCRFFCAKREAAFSLRFLQHPGRSKVLFTVSSLFREEQCFVFRFFPAKGRHSSLADQIHGVFFLRGKQCFVRGFFSAKGKAVFCLRFLLR
jgi:hypothetical protein